MSLFVNNSSSYGSIFSQSKALKESKENSKINFTNVLLKDNATKLNTIQTNNSETLARNEILNNITKTNSPNYEISSDFKNSIYTLKYKQGQTIPNNAVSTAYGYGVDTQGYMSSDFNKAAGLPENFKIHKSTLEEIKRYNQNHMEWIAEKLGIKNYYDSFDMAGIVNHYYNEFEKVMRDFSNKTSFNEQDLNSLPKGYLKIYNGAYPGIPKITNVFKTEEQFKEAQEIGISAMGLPLPNTLNFSPQSMSQTLSKDVFNPIMSVYPKNENGEYSKEAVFMSFLKSVSPVAYDNDKMGVLNPIAKAYEDYQHQVNLASHSNTINFNDIMTGKIDFASLLKAQAQEGWLDANVYAYENGVSWQNSSIGYGGAWFDRQFEEAKKNGWKASGSSIDSYVSSIMNRLNNLMGQTRV